MPQAKLRVREFKLRDTHLQLARDSCFKLI